MTRLIYIIFGGLATIFGVAIATWLVYNLLVEKQQEFKDPLSPRSYLLPFAMIVIGFAMLRKGVRGLPADNGVPNSNDWLPLGPSSELDEACAYRNFFGKSHKRAVEMFEENAMRYQEDLFYMPKAPFTFYLRAYIEYLYSDQSIGDSDAASCFMGLMKSTVKYSWDNFDGRFEDFADAVEYVAKEQGKFEATESIYGSFESKRESIFRTAAIQMCEPNP